jgi:DNA ligase-1
MTPFAALFSALDGTPKATEKVAALAAYFATAPEPDRVWTIALLSGRRPRRAATTAELRIWAAETAGLSDWLFDECYATVGDLAETIALVLPAAAATDPGALPSLSQMLGLLAGLPGQPPELRRGAVQTAWARLPPLERFLFNKLLTGGFRMGVSQGLMTRALAQATGLAATDLAHRLMGDWNPASTGFASLIAGNGAQDGARPYPFALASALSDPPAALGPPGDWIAEWKWDGIRGQLVRRPSTTALWSRGEELVTDRFPDLAGLAAALPDGTVIDAEILAWDATAARPLPFSALQRRLGRKTVPRALLADAPARLLAYDLLEDGGTDLRAAPLAARRARLAALLAGLPAGLPVALSPALEFSDWDELAALRQSAREIGAEGLMLKRASSAYHVGRRRGDWWKWKLDPFSIDAVLLYAQAGHGRRATLFTDFTFGVRDGNSLVPVAKAYSGLTDAEFAEITRWVTANALERFGPVRKVPAELVFELGFEGINPSPRHKSGVALRFPRMLRWRRDKGVAEIDSLDDLKALLAPGRA